MGKALGFGPCKKLTKPTRTNVFRAMISKSTFRAARLSASSRRAKRRLNRLERVERRKLERKHFFE